MIYHVTLEESDLTVSSISDLLSVALSGNPNFGVDYDTEDYQLYRQQYDCFEDVLARIILAGKSIIIYSTDDEGKWLLTKEAILNVHCVNDSDKEHLNELLILWDKEDLNLWGRR